MHHRHDISRPDWVVAQAAAGGATSDAQGMLGMQNSSVQVTYTGTVAGTFKLQISDFGNQASGNLPTATQWSDLPGSSQTVPTVTSPLAWLLQNIGSKWLRVVFTDGGSSTGSFSAAYTGRGAT